MMIILQSNSSPQVTLTALPTTADPISTPADPFFDSELLSVSGAVAWNEYLISGVSLDKSLTFTNQTPEVCSISSTGQTTRIASGTAIIYVSDGGISRKRCVLTMANTAGQTVTTFNGYTEDSLSDLCAAEVVAMLAAGGALAYYSTVNHSSATYTRNPSCWMTADLGAVSCANRNAGGAWGHQRAGTAIASRFVAFANHYAPPVGSDLRFAAEDGSVSTHTILAYNSPATGGNVLDDIAIAAITPALPAGITPMKVAGDWMIQGAEEEGVNSFYYLGGLGAWIDQNKNAYAVQIGEPTAKVFSSRRTGAVNGDTFTDVLVTAPRSIYQDSFYLASHQSKTKTPVSGDSGSPIMAILDGEPVLLWTWYSNQSGTPYFSSPAMVNAAIASAATNAGISPQTVTVAPDPTA